MHPCTQVLVMLIGLTYGTVAPLVLPFAVIFFALGCVVYQYQLVYVFTPKYESGGAMWPLLVKQIIFGMIVAQCTIIGVRGALLSEMFHGLTKLGSVWPESPECVIC